MVGINMNRVQINWKNNAGTTSSELDKGIISIALSTQKISVKSLTKEADSENNKFRKTQKVFLPMVKR